MPQGAPARGSIRSRTIRLQAMGGETAALVTEPTSPGPHPAIVFGCEAMGINSFGRRVAEDAAALGYVTITPDYYRGAGPSKPDSYDDFTEVLAAIEALDFRQATFDVLAAVDWARAQPNVDPERVAVWGYCTGATLAMLAASLDRTLAAAVLFFPSQPVFETLTPKRPAHPMDMIWSIACPVLVIYGDQDPLMPPERLAELRRRLELWGVPHEIRIYQGAGHAFSAPAAHMHNAAATEASWAEARGFLERALAARRHIRTQP